MINRKLFYFGNTDNIQFGYLGQTVRSTWNFFLLTTLTETKMFLHPPVFSSFLVNKSFCPKKISDEKSQRNFLHYPIVCVKNSF